MKNVARSVYVLQQHTETRFYFLEKDNKLPYFKREYISWKQKTMEKFKIPSFRVVQMISSKKKWRV